MTKKFLVLFTSLFIMLFAFSVSVQAARPDSFKDYVDEDGYIQHGWHLEANDINVETWRFGKDGNPSKAYAAEGDTSEQFTYNYAIRNLAIGAADSYSMEATFTPDSESDASVERAYGILLWYQNPENFLIYWLQQKIAPDWSGQFYGRVNNVWKEMYVPQDINALGNIGNGYSDSWRRMEFNDMWWDSNHANPQLRGNRTALLTNTVTLKVNSDVETITVGGVASESRYFEIFQVVNGVSHKTAKFYIKDVNSNSDSFYTGLYAERFNVGISDYKLECETDFAGAVESEIAALPSEITTDSEALAVVEAANNYKSLLVFQDGVSTASKEKIQALDEAVAPYIDSRILGLDENKATFVEDVYAVDDLFNSIPVIYQDEVVEIDALIEAIEKAGDWEDPTIIKPEVTITTPANASAGEVEVTYTVSDNLTAVEDLIVEVQVKKVPNKVIEVTNNKFIAEEGKYNIIVSATDEHGNKTTATHVLTVGVADTEKPVVEITTPATAEAGNQVEVKYTATDNLSTGDELTVQVSVTKDGQSVQLSNNKFTAEAGTYTITVVAKDAAGNITTVSKDVVVGSSDTEKPVVTITTPATAEVGEEVLITYRANDDTSAANKMTSVINVTKDGQEVAVSGNKFTAEAGTYTITVTVTDEAGNSTTATSTVTVGASAPDAPKSGCGGSVVASILGVLSLGAMAFAFGRKRKEF